MAAHAGRAVRRAAASAIVRADPRLLLAIAALPYLVLSVIQLAFNLAFPRITTFTELNFDRFAPGRAVPRRRAIRVVQIPSQIAAAANSRVSTAT